MKLELGCGLKKQEGFIGVDIVEGDADIIHDLDKFPYPFEDSSAEIIWIHHVLEHLKEPLKVMEECYRIGKPGCLIHVHVPKWRSAGPNSNPWHLHAFRPRWFEYLCNMQHDAMCKSVNHSFKLKSMKWLRGRKRFWHIYELQAVLEVIK